MKIVTTLAPVLIAVAATVPAAAQQPADVVRRGLDAIGGAQAVRSLGGLTIEYYSTNFTLGQSELPASPPRATVSYGRTVNDWRGWRRTTSQETRTLAGQLARQRTTVARGVGMQAAGAPMGALAVAQQERAMRQAPDRLLLAALDNPAALSTVPSREFRGQMHAGVRYAGADTATLWFDRGTGMLTVVETVTDDPILGDRITHSYYTRWQDAGLGVRFPRQQDVFVNGVLQQHIINTRVVAEATPPDSIFAIPDSLAAAAQRQPAGPAPVAVTLNQLGPGVWRAEGGSHHTLVVEQGDQLLLVEAPQTTQRVRAVLDTLRSRFPNRRIGTVVNTHHHWDHSGGLREVVAEGIPVVTHQANVVFVRQVADARRSVAPDLQERRRRRAVVQVVTDSMVIGSGASMVVVYTTPTAHAEGLVSVWVPSARVLFTSDVLNPAATLAQAGSAELVALARARGLAPESYAGGHGALVPWANVERAAAGN
jgi:glyoxylase-like metal-dependent hydrolase (beta-lactamase superfamily II)